MRQPTGARTDRSIFVGQRRLCVFVGFRHGEKKGATQCKEICFLFFHLRFNAHVLMQRYICILLHLRVELSTASPPHVSGDSLLSLAGSCQLVAVTSGLRRRRLRAWDARRARRSDRSVRRARFSPTPKPLPSMAHKGLGEDSFFGAFCQGMLGL